MTQRTYKVLDLLGAAVHRGHEGCVLQYTTVNSARTFGPAVASGYWQNDLVYWIGPLLGGAQA